MKRTLIDFWYGNINPQDHKQDDPRIADLLKLMERNRSDLAKTLNESQRESLEKDEDCANEMTGYCERDIFVYAFRLGMRMAIEALTDEEPEDIP